MPVTPDQAKVPSELEQKAIDSCVDYIDKQILATYEFGKPVVIEVSKGLQIHKNVRKYMLLSKLATIYESVGWKFSSDFNETIVPDGPTGQYEQTIQKFVVTLTEKITFDAFIAEDLDNTGPTVPIGHCY